MPQDPPKLRVMARGDAMVPHFEHVAIPSGHAPQRRVSHAHEPFLGPQYIDVQGPNGAIVRQHGAWVKRVGKDEIQEVPTAGHSAAAARSAYVDYLRALRDGDLYPADPPTAQAVGFPFYLKGEQLDKALAGTGTAVAPGWRATALRAQKNGTSVWDEVVLERDAEHSDDAVAARDKELADLREKYAPETLAKTKPHEPKGVIV